MTDDEKAKARADAFAALALEATKRCRHFYQAYPDQPDCACAGCIKDAIERAVAAEREACAKIAEEHRATDSMNLPCPDGKEGCLVLHQTSYQRPMTFKEIASAIRARNGGGA